MKLSIILFIFLSLLSFSYEDKPPCNVRLNICQKNCHHLTFVEYRPKCLARCYEAYQQCLKNRK